MTTLTRILLIDDDDVDRQAVIRALRASDLAWDLTEAANGAQGLAAAQASVFDCVLLDYRLPDVDAFDLLANLLSREGGRQAVLMLTGEGNPDTALKLMRAGALDHLAKAEMTPQGLARAIRYAKARRGFLSELEAAKREAEEKSVALDELSRQKSLLFSIIAHDLRNPFQLVLGSAGLLQKAIAEQDTARLELFAHGIHQAAEQAHKLMEELFQWAALQMESAEVAVEPLDLRALTIAAVEPCREQAKRKGITVDIECESLRIRSNREMLTTILRNIVGNAIKFTPPGGRVRVFSQGADEQFELQVCDTGVGMSPEILEDLFRVDRRTTTPGTAGERGSGLGLLLCRDLAEKLGTSLAVHSELGQGTTFSLRLRRDT